MGVGRVGVAVAMIMRVIMAMFMVVIRPAGQFKGTRSLRFFALLRARTALAKRAIGHGTHTFDMVVMAFLNRTYISFKP